MITLIMIIVLTIIINVGYNDNIKSNNDNDY